MLEIHYQPKVSEANVSALSAGLHLKLHMPDEAIKIGAALVVSNFVGFAHPEGLGLVVKMPQHSCLMQSFAEPFVKVDTFW